MHEGAISKEFLDNYCAAYERLKQGPVDTTPQLAALLALRPDDACVRLHLERQHLGTIGVEMVMAEK